MSDSLAGSAGRIASGLFGLLLLIVLALMGIERGLDMSLVTKNPVLRNAAISDNDELWHLATGRVIAETGRVPDTDPFTFTAGDTRWTNPAWLAQLVLWKLYAAGGIQLVWSFAIFLWLGAVALVHERARRRGASALAVVPASFYVLVVLRRASEVRPQGWTFVLLALAVLLIDVIGTSRKRAAALGLVLVLSEQLHGGFVFVYAAVGFALLAKAHESWSAQSPRRPVLLLVGALAIGLAGFALHPHGYSALAAPFRFFLDKRLSGPAQYTTEHAPPDFRGPAGLMIEGPLLLILLAAATRSRKLTIEDAVVTLPFLHLALNHGRGLHVYAIVVAGPLVLALDALIAEARALLPARFTALILDPLESGARLFVKGAPVALAAAVLVTLGARSGSFAPGRPGDMRDRLLAPHVDTAEMTSYVAALPASKRLFHSLESGGALAFGLYPERKIFIDGRSAEVHALSGAFDEFKAIWCTDPGWEAILDRRGCDLALVPHGLPLEKALRAKGWPALHENSSFVLLARPSKN